MLLRSFRKLAAALGVGGAVFLTLGSLMAQQPTFLSISDCNCPAPCPPAVGAPGEPSDVPSPGEEGEDLPEVADLSPDAGFAGGPQSAMPNAIGDSVSGVYCVVAGSILVAPGGGYRYKATSNNSAIPQCRVYYNYNYFSEVDAVSGDLQRHTFGYETIIGGGCSSVGIQVPTHYDSDELEIGDLGFYTKTILMQDCSRTISAGIGLTIPTAPDDIVNNTVVSNDAWLIAPYVATYIQAPCSNTFFQGFVQVDLPIGDNGVTVGGVATGGLQDATMFYADGSLGYWLRQDSCGNGVALMSELHYTRVLEDDVNVAAGICSLDQQQLNATVGAALVNNCWSVTPTLVLPLLPTPDRNFDWEAQVLINRRF
ncbi:MAG: hypothetical protein KDA41_22695 [Planctomycetales bacterium]|nr:hypothetical protein [Planctomycetales bacterium]